MNAKGTPSESSEDSETPPRCGAWDDRDRDTDTDGIRVIGITPAQGGSFTSQQYRGPAPGLAAESSAGAMSDIKQRALARLREWTEETVNATAQGRPGFTTSLRENTKFQNPSLCKQMIDFCEVDEHGTNSPLTLQRRSELGTDGFYEDLSERQVKLAKAKANRSTTKSGRD